MVRFGHRGFEPTAAWRSRGAIVVAVLIGAMATSGAADGPLAPSEALKTFVTDPGLRVEGVAAEPLVVSPSAMAWDADGRLFVAENPGYPTGPGPGRGPVGAVVELVDDDGDGRMDRRVVFADHFGFPNGLMSWRGGWLVTDAPDLVWLADTDGDGRADVREVWFTGFATNQTTQLRACYPTLGPDGWIYVARGWSGGVVSSPRWPQLAPVDLKGGDFRFRPDGTASEVIGGNCQFGMVLDDVGRRFLVSNRNPLMQAVVAPRWWRRQPALPFMDLVQDVSPSGYEARVFPRSADTTTAGYMPELMAAPHAGSFTAACGIHQYYGEGLGAEYEGSWFICEPAQNLVQRQVAGWSGATFRSRRAREGAEFLASSDGWFRPVFAATGPDGGLYIADMYRRMIDHPDYLPADVRGKLDFVSGKESGRIWRIARESARSKRERPGAMTVAGWVAAVGSTNGWVRQTAHRLLAEQQAAEAVARLLEAVEVDAKAVGGVRWGEDPVEGPHWGRIRRLWALADAVGRGERERESRGRLESHTLGRVRNAVWSAVEDPAPGVRETAWRLLLAGGAVAVRPAWVDMEERVNRWVEDPNAGVRLMVGLWLGEPGDEAWRIAGLVRLARSDAGDRWMRAAVASGSRGRERAIAEAFFREPVADTAEMAEWVEGWGRLVSGIEGGEGLERDWLGRLLAVGAEGTGWQAAGLRGMAEARRERGKPGLRKALEEWDREAPEPGGGSRGERFERVGARQAEVALDRRMGEAARRVALQFLGELGYARARAPLVAVLGAEEAVALQVQAVRVMGRFDEVEAGRWLTERGRWARFPSAVREAVVTALVSRAGLLPALFEALERGDVAVWMVDPQRRRQLQEHSNPELRERARRLFREAGGGDRWRVYESLKPAAAENGSGARGREVFRRVCANCHRLGGEGVNVGPDLSGVRNQPAEALLLHIVVPDAEIYPGYQACEVETRDGRSLSGLLVSDTADAVVLRRAGGEEERVARSAVAAFSLGRLSLMPQELEKAMTREELVDLLACLRGRP